MMCKTCSCATVQTVVHAVLRPRLDGDLMVHSCAVRCGQFGAFVRLDGDMMVHARLQCDMVVHSCALRCGHFGAFVRLRQL